MSSAREIKATLGQFNRTDLISERGYTFERYRLVEGYGGQSQPGRVYRKYHHRRELWRTGQYDLQRHAGVEIRERRSPHCFRSITIAWTRTCRATSCFDVVDNFYRGPMTPEQYNSQGVPFTDELYAFGKNERIQERGELHRDRESISSPMVSRQCDLGSHDSLTFRSISASACDYASG